MRRLAIGTLLATAVVLAGCSSGGAESAATSDNGGPVSVVTAFYPLEYATAAVGVDAVSITSLTPPGVEPHDLELTAQQVAQIAEADLVVYVGGFQPAVDEAVDQQAADRALDVSAGLPLLAAEEHAGETDAQHADHAATDPHVWLDPANMAVIGQAIGERLEQITPSSADAVRTSVGTFQQQMTDLNGEFSSALATCAIRDLVVSHEAFGYLADAYDFTQVGLSGLSPEAEPSPARLAEVADLVKRDGITTVYYETLVDPRIAQTIADETGATTAVLDPLEGLAEGSDGDYASIMRANLAALVAGQSCS